MPFKPFYLRVRAATFEITHISPTFANGGDSLNARNEQLEVYTYDLVSIV